jgi:hypothetical protein
MHPIQTSQESPPPDSDRRGPALVAWGGHMKPRNSIFIYRLDTHIYI